MGSELIYGNLFQNSSQMFSWVSVPVYWGIMIWLLFVFYILVNMAFLLLWCAMYSFSFFWRRCPKHYNFVQIDVSWYFMMGQLFTGSLRSLMAASCSYPHICSTSFSSCHFRDFKWLRGLKEIVRWLINSIIVWSNLVSLTLVCLYPSWALGSAFSLVLKSDLKIMFLSSFGFYFPCSSRQTRLCSWSRTASTMLFLHLYTKMTGLVSIFS